MSIADALRYDPITGKFYWLPDQRYGNHEAGSRNKNGYIVIGYKGKQEYAHRIAWFKMTGVWPDFIDHDNGVTDDNRFTNLKSVPKKINLKNMQKFSTNTSSVTGVSLQKQTGKWRACIGVNSKQIALGCFTSFDDAVKARKQAEIDYGFNPNHGRNA